MQVADHVVGHSDDKIERMAGSVSRLSHVLYAVERLQKLRQTVE